MSDNGSEWTPRSVKNSILSRHTPTEGENRPRTMAAEQNKRNDQFQDTDSKSRLLCRVVSRRVRRTRHAHRRPDIPPHIHAAHVLQTRALQQRVELQRSRNRGPGEERRSQGRQLGSDLAGRSPCGLRHGSDGFNRIPNPRSFDRHGPRPDDIEAKGERRADHCCGSRGSHGLWTLCRERGGVAEWRRNQCCCCCDLTIA